MGRHTKEEVERMWQYSHDYDARELAAMLVDCERNLRLEKELHRRTRAEAKRLNAAPASAEAVADSIIDAIVAETRAHLERMERLWGDLSRAASSPGGAA